MILPDVNLLIYAIDRDSPNHKAAHRWLEKILNGTDWIGFCWPVMLAFIRLTTRAGILRNPLPPEKAVAFWDEWIDLPQVRILVPGEKHWAIFRNFTVSIGSAGNLTSDIHLACLALEHGCVLHSADNDFKRFRGLQHVNPLAQDA